MIIKKYLGIDAENLDYEEFIKNYARALFLEDREILNLSKAISNVFSSNEDS